MIRSVRLCGKVSCSVKSRALAVAVAAVAVCVATLFSSGCQTTKKVNLPKVVAEDASTGELCAAINSNSEKIKSITAMNGSVGVANQPGWANSRLFFERPNKLRVVGTAAVVGRVLDLGCDGEQFWFWSSFENEKELYYCKLDQYQGSNLARAIPIDPTMFPEALGVVEIKEENVENRTTSAGEILLTVVDKRPDGVYRKRVYIEPLTAAIQRQDVQNPQGETVLSVFVREQQYVDNPGVVMPKKLEIKCSTANETLIVNLGTPTLNDSSKLEASVFKRPTDVNAEAIDLGVKSTAGSQAGVVPPTNYQKVRTETQTDRGIAQNQNNAQSVAQTAATQPTLNVTNRPGAASAAPVNTANNTTSDGLVPFPSSVAAVPPTQTAREAAARGITTLQTSSVPGATAPYAASAGPTPQIVPASESEFAKRILSQQELQNAQTAITGVAPSSQNSGALYGSQTSASSGFAQTTNVPTTSFSPQSQSAQTPQFQQPQNAGVAFQPIRNQNQTNQRLQPQPTAPPASSGGFDGYPSISQTAATQPTSAPLAPPVAGEEGDANIPSQPSDPLNDFPELLPF